MPRLGDEARAERRNRFIQAARRCVATKGYRSFTVDDVCSAAGGLSKGAFYTYFDSKQDLLIALLEEEARSTEALIEQLSRDRLSDLERAHRFLRRVLERGEDLAEVQMRADLWSEMVTDPVVREHLRSAVARRRKLLAGWAESGTASEELVEVPANAFAAVLIALADGLMLHKALDPSGFRWANIGKVIDILFDALHCESPES